MFDNNYTCNHKAICAILDTRGMDEIPSSLPLWKLKLTVSEYESLKQTLRDHIEELEPYGIEAALCYAEWWRRDYLGNIPSKEDVVESLGLNREYAESVYMAARKALKRNGYKFIHSLKGTEYFRTLLNQGGLPVNYIKNNDGNMGNFTRFLKGLVSELSIVNYDWNNEDRSIIQQFNCISYLGKSFKNENIFDVAMQIAHAIIMDDNSLLPYDDTDESLSLLTKSLKKEYTHAKKMRHVKPLSLHWKLKTTSEGQGFLFVNLDIVKDISSDSIPGINTSTCYSFDVFIEGTLTAKYVRKTLIRDGNGNIVNAIYTRITIGMVCDILWHGTPVVEVKIRCDNDERFFLTVCGCFAPDFNYPQVFQMLDDNIYIKSETSNKENNIVVYSLPWNGINSHPITIEGRCLYYSEFTDRMKLENHDSGEIISLTNSFTPYTVEFSGNYISWIEKANYKLLNHIPVIRVYDKEKNRVYNYKTSYRVRNSSNTNWRRLNNACVFPFGLVDIKVEFPDGHFVVETFYAIGNLNFCSNNEEVFSTEVVCMCNHNIYPEIETMDNVEITKMSQLTWKITRKRNSAVCPSVCNFRLYSQGNPDLKITVAIPFDGVTITDINGNILPNGKIISFTNLANYRIVSHGAKNRKISVSYTSDKIEDLSEVKTIQSRVITGIVSLSDYHDLILRMFNLYGINSFDRNSSVELNVYGKKIYVRKFVLDSTIEEGNIRITDSTEVDTDGFIYKGSIYAFPVGDELSNEDFHVIKLERETEKDNMFLFPKDFNNHEIVVFSGPDVNRRIIPKYFDRREADFEEGNRTIRSAQITSQWGELLTDENLMTGKHWQIVCKAFEICSNYNLPFTTYNGIRAIALEPKLLVKFVIAMWLNENKEVLIHDIDRFEQELVIALHWIPAKLWEECISEFMNTLPQQLLPMIVNNLVELLQDLYNYTLSTDMANDFVAYLVQRKINSGKILTKADVSEYKMRIHGLSDNNHDLPLIKFHLNGVYYPYKESMLPYYRVMIESAMCAAENTCEVENRVNLFSYDNKDYARVVNFYRIYFKETYSEIFFNTVKLINSKDYELC